MKLATITKLLNDMRVLPLSKPKAMQVGVEVKKGTMEPVCEVMWLETMSPIPNTTPQQYMIGQFFYEQYKLNEVFTDNSICKI